MSEEPGVGLTWSSGNVFADLELEDPELLQAKAEMAIAITSTIRKRGLTQVAAARELDTDQAKISAIVRGRLDDFSLSRLMNYARGLGWDIKIGLELNAEPERRGRVTVSRSDAAFSGPSAGVHHEPGPGRTERRGSQSSEPPLVWLQAPTTTTTASFETPPSRN